MCDCSFNIFGFEFVTKQAIWRCQLGLQESVMRIFHYFLTKIWIKKMIGRFIDSHTQRQRKIALSDGRKWNVFSPMEQSAPVQLASQMHVPESVLKVPWLEHCSGQVLFRISQLIPPQPGLQWHSPWWQAPWPEHIASTQSTEDDSDVSLPLLDRISNLLIYPGHFDSATSQNHFCVSEWKCSSARWWLVSHSWTFCSV